MVAPIVVLPIVAAAVTGAGWLYGQATGAKVDAEHGKIVYTKGGRRRNKSKQGTRRKGRKSRTRRRK